MGKKTKKSTIVIDGIEYKVVEWTNPTETNLKYIPQIPSGVIGSGLHIPKKNKHRTHWDYYDGKKKIEGKKKDIEEPLKFPPMAIINFKNHQVFQPPPDNQIAVLRGSDKPMEFISLKYYEKNKERYLSKYRVAFGSEDNPQVLELKS